ncbi:MAG: nitrilase-related carbon-nitrogen hydrolase, partial [Acidimicrobiia bacterium]
MKVAAVQHDVMWEDGAATRRHLEPLVGTAAAAGARLVVLTEMFPTGFSMDPERVAEPEGGPTTEFLRTQAAELNVWLTGSVPT